MITSAAILVALIVITIILAVALLIRPTITAGATGKILAFIALCFLPAMCVLAGLSAHVQRSEQTQFCISCHSMETHGQSLYVDDPNYLAARHFQNHLVPADTACYACHADYTIFGPLRDKARGLTRIYFQYVSKPPAVITIRGGYNNSQCLRCHAGARNFEENAVHSALMDTLKSNQMSCVSSGCHDTVHNVAAIGHVKMWSPGQ